MIYRVTLSRVERSVIIGAPSALDDSAQDRCRRRDAVRGKLPRNDEDSRIPKGRCTSVHRSSDVAADNFTEKRNAPRCKLEILTRRPARTRAIERRGRLEQCRHYGAKGRAERVARCAHLRSDIAGMRASIRTLSYRNPYRPAARVALRAWNAAGRPFTSAFLAGAFARMMPRSGGSVRLRERSRCNAYPSDAPPISRHWRDGRHARQVVARGCPLAFEVVLVDLFRLLSRDALARIALYNREDPAHRRRNAQLAARNNLSVVQLMHRRRRGRRSTPRATLR